MEINFFDLLKFAQENGAHQVYDEFIDEILKLIKDPDLKIEIKIPEEILEQYLLFKL
ncbi:hypothetical protein [Chryseobacterium wanjuense]